MRSTSTSSTGCAQSDDAPRRSSDWHDLEVELAADEIGTTDLGIFSSVVPTTFDYEAAAAILVR